MADWADFFNDAGDAQMADFAVTDRVVAVKCADPYQGKTGTVLALAPDAPGGGTVKVRFDGVAKSIYVFPWRLRRAADAAPAYTDHAADIAALLGG